MRALPYLVIAVILLLSLAACIGQPLAVSRSSEHITLRWWSDELAESQAAATAGAYCSQMGKAAVLGGLEQIGSASIGRYRCI